MESRSKSGKHYGTSRWIRLRPFTPRQSASKPTTYCRSARRSSRHARRELPATWRPAPADSGSPDATGTARHLPAATFCRVNTSSIDEGSLRAACRITDSPFMRSGADQSNASESRYCPSLCSTASRISHGPGRALTSTAPAPSPKRIAVLGSSAADSITADIFSAPITSTSPKCAAICAAIAIPNKLPALAMGTSIAGVLSSPNRAATSAAGPGNPGRALPLATNDQTQ